MKVSLHWLRDYVETDLSAEALGDLLTMSGLELEGIETTEPDLDGVLVGHVESVRPHPNADRLRVCTVDLGEGRPGEPVQIVCGAPNVAEGQKVAVVTVGSTLMLPSREDPSKREPVKIKKSKIRGEVSQGMICAEDELGLGSDHDGIMVLDAAAPVGLPFADYLASKGDGSSDAVLDLAITPNRPDAISHIGVARDVSALTGVPLRRPDVSIPDAGGEASDTVPVTIEVPEKCPRFVGMIIKGVTVGESPEWLKRHLVAVGLRPISNVVDVTNFVMLETGQPLHAYDLDKLAGPAIRVVTAAAGERFTTLDGTERKLPEGTVMVADADGYVGIAGIMGGAESEVGAETTNVFVEGAYWNPVAIRTAAKALGMQTDASYRFERGVDPTGQPYAVARAAHLVAALGGGTLVDGLLDEHPRPHEPSMLTLRPTRVARVLGTDVPEDDIARLLSAIGFVVETSGGEALSVTVPPFRPDVTREIDLIEEVARLWGFDRIPSPATTPVPLIPAGDTPDAQLLDRVRTRLVGLGFQELYTNSLVPKETAERFAAASWTSSEAPVVETLNPISQEMAAMRPSLLPGVLGVAAYNTARGADALRFMELGHVYRKAGEGAAEGPVAGYHEHRSLLLGLMGSVQRKGWSESVREADFFDLKGALFHVLGALGLPVIDEIPEPAPGPLTAYRLHLDVKGQRLGTLARVSDAIMEAYDLPAPLYIAELNADRLATLAQRDRPVRYEPIGRFPAVDRDLAVVVDAGLPVGPLLGTIRTAAGGLLQSVRVFDLYEGDRIEEGKKSLAFALRFGADRTLRDAEVDGRIKKVVAALEHGDGAMLRG